MSNPFANTLNTGNEKIAGDQDRIGGFRVHESGAYLATIKTAYAGKSDGGANSMTYDVEFADGSKFSWTEWVTSGTAKGCLPYFEKDGQKNYLPGFNRANAMALMTAGVELGNLTFEEKVIKLRSKAANNAEVPTPVMMATQMIGKQIIIGLQKVITNKQVALEGQKDEKGKQKYVNTNEKRELNEVDKVFNAADKRTLQEAYAKVEVAEFYDKWVEANKEPRDRFKPVEGAPAAGAPGQAGGNDKPTNSLFS